MGNQATNTDLESYKKTSFQLQRIMDKLKYLGFDNRYEIERLGNEALGLIKDFEPSKYFDNKYFNKNEYIKRLSHTLNQEVHLLVKCPDKASKKNKKYTADTAIRYLLSDIKPFKALIDSIVQNEEV